MGKHDKILARMSKKPVPSNIDWKDMEAALKHLGYDLIKGRGSRRKFYHKGKDLLISCHEPHPQPEVDKGCVADIVEHLRINGFVEADER